MSLGPCVLCGHAPACGIALGLSDSGEQVRLCHTDDHSCYVAWTVHGRRPGSEVEHEASPLILGGGTLYVNVETGEVTTDQTEAA